MPGLKKLKKQKKPEILALTLLDQQEQNKKYNCRNHVETFSTDHKTIKVRDFSHSFLTKCQQTQCVVAHYHKDK